MAAQIKMFELRDKATFIPIIAIRLNPELTDHELTPDRSEAVNYLIRRLGWRSSAATLIHSESRDKTCKYPEEWGADDRTYSTAHRWIEQNWDGLNSGDVIDVEWILRESNEIKASERFEYRA